MMACLDRLPRLDRPEVCLGTFTYSGGAPCLRNLLLSQLAS